MPEKPQTAERRDVHANDADNSAEPVTGVLPATRDFVREVNRTGLWKTSWALIITAGAIVTGTLWAYRAAAAEARDAGTKAAEDVKRQADEQGEALKRLQIDFTAHVQVEADHRVRVEKKLNALLDHEGVKDPAPTPPPPKDGGR